MPVEISAAAVVIGFWDATTNPGVWITVLIVLIVFLNLFVVGIYGEAEFIFASIKIPTIVGLILLALILDLGGGPKHDRLGFRYWKNPGAMVEYCTTGSTGRFLGFFSVLINAAFSYAGVEVVAIAAGETEYPRENIPKAVRRVFWRILFFYTLGSLAIGALVPSNDATLLKARASGVQNGATSPWVIAIVRAGIPTSSANLFFFTGSRYMYALAVQKQAPAIFTKCIKAGVPIYGVGITAIFSLLTYLSLSSGPNQVFLWLQSLTIMATLLTWTSICVTYIQFRRALAVQGIGRDTLVFKVSFQPYGAWFALVFFVVIIIFDGFSVFFPGQWDVYDFVTAYIGIPVFFRDVCVLESFQRNEVACFFRSGYSF
ncbi:related to general amino acid permease [Phialocephala subalpina]|uniref:Related to general amino acid permease n=1 Tax=Phialocephala subalpina TaxID=576137 RepID=A0A1L7X303_9HELO|nr:related to general amino acid permease [Phialocephala subalpina]